MDKKLKLLFYTLISVMCVGVVIPLFMICAALIAFMLGQHLQSITGKLLWNKVACAMVASFLAKGALVAFYASTTYRFAFDAIYAVMVVYFFIVIRTKLMSIASRG